MMKRLRVKGTLQKYVQSICFIIIIDTPPTYQHHIRKYFITKQYRDLPMFLTLSH